MKRKLALIHLLNQVVRHSSSYKCWGSSFYFSFYVFFELLMIWLVSEIEKREWGWNENNACHGYDAQHLVVRWGAR